jgi:biopolymer transport protein ExbD
VKVKRFDQINVVPFIDIMLVLLVIVLTTATFIAQGKIKVNLPKADTTKSTQSTKRVILSITSDGSYFFDETKVSKAILAKRLEQLKKEDLILLKSDKEADFEYFVTVIDLLKKNKLDNLAIATMK